MATDDPPTMTVTATATSPTPAPAAPMAQGDAQALTKGWATSEVQAAAVVAVTALGTAVTKLQGWQLVTVLGIVSLLVCVTTICRSWVKARVASR